MPTQQQLEEINGAYIATINVKLAACDTTEPVPAEVIEAIDDRIECLTLTEWEMIMGYPYDGAPIAR